MQVHLDDAGNALGHVMHTRLWFVHYMTLSNYPHHPRAGTLKHLLPAKCNILIICFNQPIYFTDY